MKSKPVLWFMLVVLLIIVLLVAACAAPTPAPTPTPTPTPTPAIPAMKHTLEGRTDCLLCHGPTGVKPFPANHAGRTNATCVTCHKPAQ